MSDSSGVDVPHIYSLNHSWEKTMSLLSHYLKLKTEQFCGSASAAGRRTDTNLPLGLRIGAIVELPEHQFLLGRGKFQFEFPGKKHRVIGWSECIIAGSPNHRIYLQSDEDSQKLSFLQIYLADNPAEGDETFIFQEAIERHPTTVEDWEQWCPNHDDPRQEVLENSLIGLKDLTIPPNGTQFWRLIDNDGPSWIPPIRFMEQAYFDPYGRNVHRTDYAMMVYLRDIIPDTGNQDVEYMIAAKEDEEQGARIRIYLGAKLNRPIRVF